jgi:hypothetical protein
VVQARAAPLGLPALIGPLSGQLVEANASQAHKAGAARSATWGADARPASSVSAVLKADRLGSNALSQAADAVAPRALEEGEAAVRGRGADAAGGVRRIRWLGGVTSRYWLRRFG